MYGADKKCDARIRARASRKRKKMEAASTEQSFQPTAMNPLQLLTDTAAKQTPAKQQHAAKDPHSCTEGSDFEDEERPLPKADDGPSVYSKDPKCSICFELLPLHMQNLNSLGGWGYIKCCGQSYHRDCLHMWLKPATVQDWTSSNSNKKVSMQKVCPTCKSDRVSHSSTRMFCTDAKPGGLLPTAIRKRRTSQPSSPRSHRNSRTPWRGREAYMQRQLHRGGKSQPPPPPPRRRQPPPPPPPLWFQTAMLS